MAEESDLERTEPASARRIERAREEGNVPQSRELTAFMVLAAGTGALWVLGGWLAHRSSALLGEGLRFDRRLAFEPDRMTEFAVHLGSEALITLAPVFLATIAAAILAPIAVGGLIFSSKAFQLDFGRMDPVKGIGRMFSWQSLAELVKALLKALLILGIIVWVVVKEQDQLFALTAQSIDVALAAFARLLLVALAAVVTGVALIALLDVPFQLWQYYDRLKMTREELRQEHKEMEGDPQLKARIRSQQREIARRRMMSEVPKADVVVTNPTHFAVALRYDADRMVAPQVVAKGINLIAQRIRELAAEHDVPLVEAPALARALHRHTEPGDGVPAALYAAVAEVMAYVYQLDQYVTSGGRLLPPEKPGHIAVPDELDPGIPADAVVGMVAA